MADANYLDGAQSNRHVPQRVRPARQLSGGQTDFDVVPEKAQKHADPPAAIREFANAALRAPEAAGGDADPIAFLKNRRQRRRDRFGVLTQMCDGVVGQSRRRSSEADETDDSRRAHDPAHLLGIAKTRKQVPGKKRLCGRDDSARPALFSNADAGCERFDSASAVECERRHVFAPAFAAQAKPAQSNGIQKGPQHRRGCPRGDRAGALWRS